MFEIPSLLSLRDELDMGLGLGVSDFSLSLLSGGDRLAKGIKREGIGAVFNSLNGNIKEV